MEQFRWIFGCVYALVALLAWRLSVNKGDERGLWSAMAATLLVLGIGKALNAEDGLLRLVRSASQRQHLYGWHRAFQAVWLFFILALGAGWTMRILTRLRPVATRTVVALCSFALLTIFIAIRMASIHLVDTWVTLPIFDIRAGWWLELVALATIGAAASVPIRPWRPDC